MVANRGGIGPGAARVEEHGDDGQADEQPASPHNDAKWPLPQFFQSSHHFKLQAFPQLLNEIFQTIRFLQKADKRWGIKTTGGIRFAVAGGKHNAHVGIKSL